MFKIGNVEVYTDDVEIVDFLKEIDPISEFPFNGLSILEFIDKNTYQLDFGYVIASGDPQIIYMIYKHGSSEGSGLSLWKVPFDHGKELLSTLNMMKSSEGLLNQDIVDSMIYRLAQILSIEGFA